MKEPLSDETLRSLFTVHPKDPSRIINRESSTIEYKESYNHGNMTAYFKTIAAFANNQGGYLIFGVKDKPHTLIGLKDKSLSQFEGIKVEEFTEALQAYFSPEIRWVHQTFVFQDLCFGVIYTYPLKNKPCICKKSCDNSGAKHSLKEGDIYYRYAGRSERIRYEELSTIINEAKKKETEEFFEKIAAVWKTGISNAAILDTNTGIVTKQEGSFVISKDLLDKVAFVQEGKFVDTGGSPTLRIIGNVEPIEPKQIIIAGKKETEKAIGPTEIVHAFLKEKPVDEPKEYLKQICYQSSANFPIYFFINRACINISDALSFVSDVPSRSCVKQKIIGRLQGKRIQRKKLPTCKTLAGQKKEAFLQQWLSESLPETIKDINHCVEALLCLSTEEIRSHVAYIRRTLIPIFDNTFRSSSSATLTLVRKAISYIDECLYLAE